jgi:hypothetical protein
MNITVNSVVYRVFTEADLLRLLFAVATLQALGGRKGA